MNIINNYFSKKISTLNFNWKQKSLKLVYANNSYLNLPEFFLQFLNLLCML